MSGTTVYVGPAVHSEVKEKITCIPKVAIAVIDGKIVSIDTTGDVNKLEGIDLSTATIKNLKDGQFLCPGFLDIHVHAPQYPNIGLGYDKQLLEWLETYTLPLEIQYKDVKFAEKVYKYAVDTSLSCGTTTACYYGTIHTDSCVKLAEVISKLGQRAIVGKVNMNRNSIPEYVENTADSLSETKKFLASIKKLNSPLVEPAITPRFAIACDMELLKGLGSLAKAENVYIQTHISETQSEIQFTKELFPDFKYYADIYKETDLLSNKTILGHCIYLEPAERETLLTAGSSVAHCPNSNIHLHSGLCPVRDLWKAGLTVGLGTDVSGGCSMSILDAIRSALTTSISLSFSKKSYEPLTYHEAFYLATVGGATALRKENVLGNFKLGKYFDALVVDMGIGQSGGVFAMHTLPDLVQKFIYCGGDQNIVEVYVNGKLVKQKN